MPSLTIPHCDGIPEQPHHSSAYCDFDEFQSLQRRRTAEVNDGDVVESRQVLEPIPTPAIPRDTEERQERKVRVATPPSSTPQFSRQSAMLDTGIAENDALFNVVRNILQLQKRQVELYEAQLGILGRYARVSNVSNFSMPSEVIKWNREAESDSFVGSKVGRAASPSVVSSVVCDKIDLLHMDVAHPAPDTEQRMKSPQPQPCQGSRSVSNCSGIPGMTATQWLGYGHVDSKAMLKPEFYASLPSDMTLATRTTLIFLGTVPAVVFEQRFLRALYRLYRCFIIASFVFVGITWLAGGFLQAWAGLFPVECVYSITFGAIAPLVFWTFWRQLGSGGAYLDMLHQLSRRRFDWKLLDYSIYVLWCSIAIAEAVVASLAFVLDAKGELALILPEGAEYSSSIRHFERIVGTLFKSSIPSIMFILALECSGIWCYWMFADMHRCDVLDYGTVLASAMEDSDGNHDVIVMLKRLEHSITARLRFANTTWVRTVMLIFCFQILMSLVIGTWMFTSHNVRGTLLASVYLMWVCVSSGVVTISMARVAETFDHDMFRVVNNPHVLHGARRYFGEQLIDHLHGLAWGFRFGGTVINTQLCSRLLLGLSSTVTITISQACYALIGNSPW